MPHSPLGFQQLDFSPNFVGGKGVSSSDPIRNLFLCGRILLSLGVQPGTSITEKLGELLSWDLPYEGNRIIRFSFRRNKLVNPSC